MRMGLPLIGCVLSSVFLWACSGHSSNNNPAAPSGPLPTTLDASFFPLTPAILNYDDGSTIRVQTNPTRLEFSMSGVLFQVVYLEDDGSGVLESRETVWVKPTDYRETGTNDAGFIQSDRRFTPPFYLFKWGLKLGEPGFDMLTDEEIVVPTGQDGMTGGCATTPWTDWKYVQQFRHAGVVANERVTVPAGTFNTLKIEMLVNERNNPFNACDQLHIDSKLNFWLASGVGLVESQPNGGRTVHLVSRS
jgi:hypothetical protein